VTAENYQEKSVRNSTIDFDGYMCREHFANIFEGDRQTEVAHTVPGWSNRSLRMKKNFIEKNDLPVCWIINNGSERVFTTDFTYLDFNDAHLELQKSGKATTQCTCDTERKTLASRPYQTMTFQLLRDMCEWFQKKKPRWDGRFWIESHGMKLPAGRPEFPGVQVKPQVWVPTTSALQHTFQCNIQPGCRLYGFDLMDFEEDSEVEISIKKTGSGNEENWDVLLCTRVSRDVAALELHSPMNLPPEASFRIQSVTPVNMLPMVVKPNPEESGTEPPREVNAPIST
jgi:hypothetical protein